MREGGAETQQNGIVEEEASIFKACHKLEKTSLDLGLPQRKSPYTIFSLLRYSLVPR